MRKEQVLLDMECAPSVELNGERVIDFSPHSFEGEKRAIVALSVLQQLASLLPEANGRKIISLLINNLQEAQREASLEAAVKICKDFHLFHQSVNLITLYEEKEETSSPIVGRIEVEEEREVDFS